MSDRLSISELFELSAEIAESGWAACSSISFASIDPEERQSMKKTLGMFRPTHLEAAYENFYCFWWGLPNHSNPDHQARILALCFCAAMTDDESEDAPGEALNLSSTISLDLGSF